MKSIIENNQLLNYIKDEDKDFFIIPRIKIIRHSIFNDGRTYVLASLEKTLIKWAKSIGREYDHVKTLHTSSGVYYGDCESKGSFWDVEVEFKKRGNTEIVLAFAKSSEDIPALFINEGVSKIVSVQKSKIKYHIDF